MLLRATSALLLIAGQALIAQAEAGTVLKTAVRDLANNREVISTSYAQQGSLRVETTGGSGTVVLFKNDVLYTLDPQQKTYLMVDQATMQRMIEQLGPALKKVQEMLASMPPEQRAQLEKTLGTSGAGSKPVVEKVRKTGRTDKIQGYACSYSEVLRDDVVSTEACVAAPATLKGSQDLLDASSRVLAFMKPLTESVDLPFLRQITSRQLDNYAQLGGIPVRVRRFDAGKAIFESTLQSISTEAVPAAMFEVPEGYTKKDLPLPR
jgi:hypothetical protein